MLVHYANQTDSNDANPLFIEKSTFDNIEVEQSRIENELITVLTDNAKISKRIKDSIALGISRLELDITDFDTYIPDLSTKLMSQPAIFLPPVNSAIKELFQNQINRVSDPHLDRRIFRDPRLALKGWLRGSTITPRGLRASRLNRIVAVEGIVTRCGASKHQVVQSTYLAERSKKRVKVDYSDDNFYKTSGSQLVPIMDTEGNRFIMEPGLTEFRNVQCFVIQEMPEVAPSGQLPVSVEVTVSGGLVDTIKAGDRISVWGVYKAKMQSDKGRLSGSAKCWIEGNNIEHLGGNEISLSIEPEDDRLIRKIAQKSDTLDHLAHSIAPTLFGGLEKKKGLLLQLAGGVQKILENSTMRVRGDINILLIGDPSCGKSQMLRFMMNVSKLSISTTGRGSSGVGLTAAARMDEENKGERVLEAGAMVMADGGLVCIDEFDKMTMDDRTAIHEVMEQQTVSISKASIQTTLNARCSVLAAANPTYGCFDDAKDYRGQICFPDSLLSRFDLIYLVHEANQPAEDRRICRKVLKNHMEKAKEHALTLAEGRGSAYKTSDRNDFAATVNRLDWTILPRGDANASVQNYEKEDAEGNIIYSVAFIKKYIQVCKMKTPELTDDAIQSISDYYTELRKKCSAGGRGRCAIPTPRTLEACIRLSTAHARLSLKDKVDASDVLRAKELLHFTMLGEEYVEIEEIVPEVPSRKKTDKSHTKKTSKKRTQTSEVMDLATETVATNMGLSVPKRQKTRNTPSPEVFLEPTAEERRSALRVYASLKESGENDVLASSAFYTRVIEENGDQAIEDAAFKAILSEMVVSNKIMIDEDDIYII